MLDHLAVIVSVVLAAGQPGDIGQPNRPTEHWSVSVDLGLVGDFDDSNLWTGGYSAGVAGYWALNAAASVGARFGICHWDYVSAPVVTELVPENAELLREQSTGEAHLLEFAPFIRYEREGVIGSALGGFVQGSVELAYVKEFALTEVAYDAGGAHDQTAKFEINDSRWRPALAASTGLVRGLSGQSWIDLLLSYRGIFDEGTTRNVWSLSLGFRMRV